jgi:uncharacterized protein YdaU (DUF1376 family)
MPLYVADFMSDTSHLSASETGAYLMLIMHYWRAGGLPDDDRSRQRISRMTPHEWTRSREKLQAFFDEDWRHGRIDSELTSARKLSNVRAASGKRGAEAKSLKNNDAGLANASGLPEQTPGKSEAISQSQSQSLETSVSKASRAIALPSRFAEFWQAYPHKVAKPDGMRAYAKVAAEHDAIMAGLARYIATTPPDRPWCNPATFLNNRRWEDQPAATRGSNGSGRPRTVQDVARELHERAVDEAAAARNTGGLFDDDAPRPPPLLQIRRN